jgi:O-methyltransferase involved in polyketide biosynthesis
MDTRPYRLSWPPSSLIFDVSPDSIYTAASEKLKAAGAKVPRMCLFQHISAEVGEGEGGWGEKLVKMGFRGDRPSVWAMQVRETLHAKTQGASMNTL